VTVILIRQSAHRDCMELDYCWYGQFSIVCFSAQVGFNLPLVCMLAISIEYLIVLFHILLSNSVVGSEVAVYIFLAHRVNHSHSHTIIEDGAVNCCLVFPLLHCSGIGQKTKTKREKKKNHREPSMSDNSITSNKQ
jgi:hypothetical protein